MCKSNEQIFNVVDRYCIDCFPEMVKIYGIETLNEASSMGTYIFHEDYFIQWVNQKIANDSDLKRVAEYIEYLASSPNHSFQDLAQIAIIEGLINLNFTIIAQHLKKESKKLLINSEKTTHFDKKNWL